MVLFRVGRLVVLAERGCKASLVHRENCSAISDVGDVADISHTMETMMQRKTPISR